MVAGYSMQSHEANLMFLRSPGEVISEEYTLNYGEDMWESGWMCMRNCFTQFKLRWFQKLKDSGYVGVGVEEDGDEAKRMGETYATMVLALYAEDLLV